MGYLTKLIRRTLLHFLTVLTCNTDLLPKEEEGRVSTRSGPGAVSSRREGSNNNNNELTTRTTTGSTFSPHIFRRVTARSFNVDPDAPDMVFVILYISLLFDCLDLVNVIVDMILIVRLLAEEDAVYYAVLLLVGLLLGRVVDFRGTTLLFRNGLDWHPFWIDPSLSSSLSTSRFTTATNIKNQRVFDVLFCLVFTETAIFLLEDYPSLVVYSHWMVVAFPPPVLDSLDNINVAMSAFSLAVLVTLFVVAVFGSLYILLQSHWKHWKLTERVWNGTKIAIFIIASGFLAMFTIRTVRDAVQIVFRDEQNVPSNKVLGIEVCADTPFDDRRELCDETIFLIRVAIAWFVAAIFTFYLIFRPAPYSYDEDDEDEEASSNPSSTTSYHDEDKNNNNNDDDENDSDEEGPSTPSSTLSNNGKDENNNDDDQNDRDEEIISPSSSTLSNNGQDKNNNDDHDHNDNDA